jgi:hypothetical protein
MDQKCLLMQIYEQERSFLVSIAHENRKKIITNLINKHIPCALNLRQNVFIIIQLLKLELMRQIVASKVNERFFINTRSCGCGLIGKKVNEMLNGDAVSSEKIRP